MTQNSDVPKMTTTDLAIERSRMAADRTLMAWIRTSLSMISFGFTIYKFFQYMIDQPAIVEKMRGEGPRHMGSALVILGTLILIPAVIQHRQFLRLLEKQSEVKFPFSLSQSVAGLIALLGLAVLANLFFRFGPF